jgi:phage terminase small subunit
MPALANIRHERFARALIRTGVAAVAYLKAGYAPTTRNALDVSACQLLRKPKVQTRIGELRRQMAARNRITVDSLVAELDEARLDARRLDQPSAAISATMSKARLVGLLVHRKETGDPGAFQGLQSEEAVLARVRAELGDDAARQLAQALQAADTQASVPS